MLYKFLGWSDFFEQLKQVRLVNVQGSMGTGKTLLSVALGYELLKRNRVAVAAYNFPVAFGSAPYPRWCFAAADEGGVFFDSRTAFRNKDATSLITTLTANLRKRGSYLAIPSFIDADKRLRVGLRVWRVRSLFFGRLWLYHWEVGPEDQEEQREGVNFWAGRLWFFNPPAFYGVYDTYYWPHRPVTFQFLRQYTSGVVVESM